MYDAAGFIASYKGYQNARFGFDNMLRLERYPEDREGFYDNLRTCKKRYLNDEDSTQRAAAWGNGSGNEYENDYASEETYSTGNESNQ